MEIDRGRGRPDKEAITQRNTSPQPENSEQNHPQAGERKRGFILIYKNYPMSIKPILEGKYAHPPLNPETFDGHELDAWQRDPEIFRKRALSGLTSLREKMGNAIEDVDIDLEQASDAYHEHHRRQGRRAPNGDDYDYFQTVKQGGRSEGYYQGLSQAFDLLIAHLQGQMEKEKPDHY